MNESKIITNIFENVQKKGDQALKEYALRFDQVNLKSIEINEDELIQITESLDKSYKKKLINNITSFIKRIEIYQKKTKLKKFSYLNANGYEISQIIEPINSVGLYIPAGKTPLISTVIMLAIPARIANVKNIIVCTPPNKESKISPELALTFLLCGIKKVYLSGGAQALAAMSLGTKTITKVGKVFGPGNRFVIAAKKYILSKNLCGVDLIAGPSEVCIYIDNLKLIDQALDEALAQTEHGFDSKALIICSNEKIKQKLELKINKNLRSQLEVAVTKSNEQLQSIINQWGPEHFVNLSKKNLDFLIKNVGAFYDGSMTSAALGDYGIGPNHTLPTNGNCRFSSALSVRDFQRSISKVKLKIKKNKKINELINSLTYTAEIEGLTAHKKSLENLTLKNKV